MKNLTDPEKILNAMYGTIGYGAVKKFAEQHGYARQYISQTIHGKRCNKTVRALMANAIGCGVYGVFPDNHKQKAPSSGPNTAVNVGTATTVPEDGHF